MIPDRRKDFLLFGLLFSISAGLAVYIYWPGLTHHAVYTSDVRQSPHWAAYHTTSFRADDFIVEYGRFNESPLQNAIYFVGTWLVDYLPLTKILSIVSYGLATCLFFFVGRAMFDERTGLLMALFFAFFPNSFEESAGFFSHFWMIPLLLLCLYVIRTERWRGLVPLLPFAALAYPMTSVLIGTICAVHASLLFFSERKKALTLLRWLVVGSILALALLVFKYVSPPEFIGPRVPRAELIAKLSRGPSIYLPILSLPAELLGRVRHPFVIVSSLVYLLLLRRKTHWELGWTSLVLGSSVCYVAADLLFVKLYLPDRYTRFSMIVLLVLWHATNWNRLLELIRSPLRRRGVLTALLVVAGFSFSGTVEYGDHLTESGRPLTPLCRFVETLPEDILVAGPPRYLDEIMLQSRRSVLSTFKLNHEWYSGYESLLHERTIAIFKAIYASSDGPINELHTRYGVTHLVLGRAYYETILLEGGLDSRYDSEIRADVIGTGRYFRLRDPPRDSVLYNDGTYIVLELPLGSP